MKKLCLILSLILTTSVAHAQRNIDVLNYSYQLDITDVDDTIYGQATITYILKKGNLIAEFDLHKGNSTEKGMTISKVALPGNFFENNFKYTFDNHKIKIITPDKSDKDELFQATIEYKGIPADGLIISKNKYGHRTFFSDNWPNRAHNWIPCVDDPADKATVEFIVTAPSHYQVVSNGVLVEETNLTEGKTSKKLTHWKEDVPLPTKVMVIGAADFAVNNIGNVNCVPVSSWVFPENKTEGFYDYGAAKEILGWYINYIGPYAYKKLANVQSKTMFGGMENASAIFYYENSITGKRQEDALIAHELVHQWFGNSATEKSFAHLWLSEGFATYLTHAYIESKYGTDSLNKRMQKEREEVLEFVYATKRPVVDSTDDYMSLLNNNSYQKGSWVLHMLRRELGDSIFKKAIKAYYELYAGKNAETVDLRKVFETVSGKNLQQFFKQWLFTNENPKLDISWKYDGKQKKLFLTVTQLQKNIFAFPLEIRTGSSRSTINKPIKLNISKLSETFSFSQSEIVSQITIDPQTSLLADFTVRQMK
jgi:aminopeptidase N